MNEYISGVQSKLKDDTEGIIDNQLTNFTNINLDIGANRTTHKGMYLMFIYGEEKDYASDIQTIKGSFSSAKLDAKEVKDIDKVFNCLNKINCNGVQNL
ncbi:hypothetical protein Barb4_01290 [Bacteroidales bacterium Barb4]|nr:hypothetical protein Barb4_01290 [Bacteroidales bacterium Barb4]